MVLVPKRTAKGMVANSADDSDFSSRVSGWALGLASCFDSQKVQKQMNFLKKRGFCLKLGPPPGRAWRFFAGSLKLRQKALEQSLLDPQCQFLWAVRGGWGSSHLLPFLWQHQKLWRKQKPRWLVGFSDVTSVMVFWNLRLRWPALHGPMIEGLRDSDQPEIEFLHQVIRSGRYQRVFELRSLNERAPNTRPIRGIFGGNLTLLAHVWGTLYRPKIPAGWWVMIEEYNEEPYRVDRLITQLELSGFWSQVSGILWASVLPKSKSQAGSLNEVIHYWSKKWTCPVLGYLPSGHGFDRKFVYLGPLLDTHTQFIKTRALDQWRWQLNVNWTQGTLKG